MKWLRMAAGIASDALAVAMTLAIIAFALTR